MLCTVRGGGMLFWGSGLVQIDNFKEYFGSGINISLIEGQSLLLLAFNPYYQTLDLSFKNANKNAFVNQ